MAPRFVRAVGHEVRKAIPPSLFFLAVFHLVAATKALLLEGYDITPTHAVVATVLALTLAKAILVADALPVMRLFADHPLAVGILWRTLLYALLCLVFRALEELIPLWWHHGLSGSLDEALAHIVWPHFWAAQIWLVFAVLIYTTFTALDRHFGGGSVTRALLTRREG